MLLPATISKLALWDQLDTAGADRAARALERRLPAPWRLVGVRDHEAGGQRRSVAFFEWKETEFALVPGGQVLLGYDSSCPPDLTARDLEDWERARYEYGGLEEHLRTTMTPLRQVVLRPFLMEVTSRQMDSEPIWQSGRIVGERSVEITVRRVRDLACADGFSLPTSDQWEHACRAGTRTFWWWGNALAFPLPDRNAFGLRIAWNTYRSEWCTDPDVYRGGDGGCSSHGGLDGLPTALRLASAYFEPFAEAGNESEEFMGDCRRVFPLSAGNESK
jgi:hypothetical protein